MTERIEIDTVPAALDGQRIDRVVALVADVARKQAAALITAGEVALDGAVVERASVKVAAGSSITINVDRPDDGLEPDPSIEVAIVHVDDEVIVVDKAAGLVVHPGSGVRGATLVNGLLARFPELANVGEPERPGIVHRLDRGTSGLLLVARTNKALDSLSAQLRERTVERRYRTLVLGHLESAAGVIDAPLGRSPRDATRRAIVADGRPARTHYEVIDWLGGDGRPEVSLLACRLETGRTHQIRAHLAAIDHPVVGDVVYGGDVSAMALGPAATRPFLHAETIAFDHPSTGERLRFTSPLPADLEAVLTLASS